MKAAEEVDLSIESHTEEVETENTVLVKNSIAFECDECSYRNNSEKGLHKHKRMKHRISQIDGANGKSKNIWPQRPRLVSPICRGVAARIVQYGCVRNVRT